MNPGFAVLRRPATRAADTLAVLLPGAYMTARDFLAAGFDAAGAERGLKLDLALPDIHIGHFTDPDGAARLRRELLDSARREAYPRVWLGGISLGGFVALAIAAEAEAAIDGLCLIAPYPGSAITLAAIDAAGGPSQWEPSPEQRGDGEFRVWHWLKTPRAAPKVAIGYGREDRFAARMDRLASVRPDIERVVVAGGHEWPAWRAVWERLLDGGALADSVRSTD